MWTMRTGLKSFTSLVTAHVWFWLEEESILDNVYRLPLALGADVAHDEHFSYRIYDMA